MNDEMRKFWEQKLIEMATEESPFTYIRKPTWKDKLRDKYFDLIDALYEKLTGRCPYEE